MLFANILKNVFFIHEKNAFLINILFENNGLILDSYTFNILKIEDIEMRNHLHFIEIFCA